MSCQGTRQNNVRNFGIRTDSAQAEPAINESRRLFTKNTGLCEVVKQRIEADACPVSEGYVRGFTSLI